METASPAGKKDRKRGPATLPPTASPDALLLTTDDIAARCRFSPQLARRLVENGTIPSVKIGRLRRVKRSDFDRFVVGLR